MSFLDTFKRSWHLTKLSWKILMQDKELLVFPVLSAIGAVLLFIGMVVPTLLLPVIRGGGSASMQAAGDSMSAPYVGILILWYLAMSFVTIFFSAALMACVKKRLGGGDPTLGYGLKEAGKRIIPILGWSLISATVGLLLRLLASRSEREGGIIGMIGQIIVSILGFAWTIVTMFVVPVIVIEGQGVFASMKRSVQLIKKTWGEQVVLVAGIGMVFGWLMFGVVLLCFLMFLVMPFLFVPLIVFGLLVIALLAVFQSALAGVFNGVLYAYATGENMPRELKDEAAQALVKQTPA